jgi:hypothetical protein
MTTVNETLETHLSRAERHHPAKWAAVVDDVVVPTPRRHVMAGLIKDQAGIGAEFVLVRDHDSPEDVVFGDADAIDLAAGNVFYRLRSCGACRPDRSPEARQQPLHHRLDRRGIALQAVVHEQERRLLIHTPGEAVRFSVRV